MTSGKSKDTASLKQLEEISQDIEMYLNVVFNNVQDPLFVKDEECRLLLVNDAFCSIFELNRNEIIGKTLAEKVPLDERDHFLSIDKKVLTDGKEILCEETLTTNGKETKTILTRKSRFVGPKGNYFLVGIIHDISERKKTERIIIEKEERLSLALLYNKIGIWEYNPQTQELIWDESMYSLYNIDRGNFSRNVNAWEESVHPDDIKKVRQELQESLAGKTPFDTEFRIVWSNGEVRHIKAVAKLFYDEDGAPVRLLGINTDVTEHHEVERKLKLSASVFTHAREGIVITDASATIIEVNDTFSLITGYTREEVLGENPRILRSGRHPQEFYTAMWSTLLEEGSWKGEVWNRRKSGRIYAELLTISAVKDNAGQTQNYVALFNDITKLKDFQHQLEHIANHDTLTNLPNRVLLADRLTQAIAQCRRRKRALAVAFLDLDGFKVINDAYGHSAGDELLIALSQRMQKALREGDTLARIGGDEFVAVIADIENPEDSHPVLERLLEVTTEPVIIGSATVRVTASIGVALYPPDGTDADQLIRNADKAMYVAKQGKNRYQLFDMTQDAAVKTLQKNIDRFRAAFKGHELVLHYQPKVNMRTGEVIGVEALIRWQHPAKGLLQPSEFLSAIETDPISLELGEWIIDTALNQINQWRSMGKPLPISVNVSAYQLQQENFATRLEVLLKNHSGVSSSFLELEILETSALDCVNQVSDTLNTCHDLGVTFALDDFGTGHSSFARLRNLSADMIKIDQCFVGNMLEDANDFAIVETIVGLAKAFNREVIAEGVETIDQGLALLQLGCELAQGYVIAKPMPADEIPKWASSWKGDNTWISAS